jgi:hypothetical protein
VWERLYGGVFRGVKQRRFGFTIDMWATDMSMCCAGGRSLLVTIFTVCLGVSDLGDIVG